MKKIAKCMLVVLVNVAFLLVSLNVSAQKREFRSTWMATVWQLDWPTKTGTTQAVRDAQKLQLRTYLDQLKETGLTGICFQVRPMADALYKSSYEPWSSVVSGSRGTDPGWDPLAYVVEECHKRGLECYAWVNPYRWSTGTDYNTAQDVKIKDAGLLLKYGNTTIFNPGLEAARTHIINVCKEIVNNYAIDGMLFDDYFYPDGIPTTSDAPDYALYQSSGTSKSIGDWRRDNVNLLIKKVYNMIQKSRPDMRFGVGPAGIAGPEAVKAHGVESPASSVKSTGYQYNGIFSDPLAWLEQGTIDFISPQIYWTTTSSTAPYGPLSDWWSKMAHRFGRHHYASQTLSTLASNNTQSGWAEIAAQVQCNRQYAQDNACGSIYYSTKSINGKGGQTGGYEGLGDYLKANKYQKRSLVPVITWKDHKVYSAPASAAINGSELSWNATVGNGAIIRYTVYAVPMDVTKEAAAAADGDGISADYLVDVTYSPSYTLPASKVGNCWYAVCVYDGYGYESEPAYIGYPEPVVEDPAEDPTGDSQEFKYEPNYKIVSDGTVDFKIGGTSLDCMWVRSVGSFGNISFESNGTLNRGMVAVGDYVYISGRSAASSSADIYLDKYDGCTGEYVGRINLNAAGKIGYLPCNDVFKDAAGNILISNLVLNINSTPIIIHKVDVETGDLTQVCSLTYDGTLGKRIDHVSVFGDVDSGEFTVFGALSSTASIVRWVFSGGALKATATATLTSFVPSSFTNLGIAPRVIPISKKNFYVSGSNTALTRYSFTSGNPTDQFPSTEFYSTTANAANGGCFFSFEGNYFMVYPATDHSGANGVTFNFVSIGPDMQMSDAVMIKSLPVNGLGKVNSTTCSAPCDYVDDGDGILRFYTYSAGNGIAAYKLTSEIAAAALREDQTTTSVNDIKVEANDQIHANQIYSLSGAYLGSSDNFGSMNLSKGIYIVKSANKVEKFIMK